MGQPWQKRVKSYKEAADCIDLLIKRDGLTENGLLLKGFAMKPQEYNHNEYTKVRSWYLAGMITEQEWQEFVAEYGRVSGKHWTNKD